MSALVQFGAVIAIAVIVQWIFPGRDVYHYGWFNAIVIALIVLALAQVRRELAGADARKRTGTLLAALGITLVGIAGVANGLLAPDPQTIIGAPGSSVRVDELGRSLDFPLIESDTRNFPPQRIAGSFLLRPVPRSVVEIAAFDARGAHLTITQPTGSAFLSPVLLMQSQQTIAGMSLPYDSFAVPAAHRMVKAVLFSAQQAAALHGVAASGGPAVLYDVEDESEKPLPHGIVFARDGETAAAGGLSLRASIAQYPAVEIIAIPNVAIASLGLVLFIAGALLAAAPIRTPSYS